ncbi:MAG: putative toxin-antitoxin system toxin component, PIN family [Blastocatellia bacterium]
MPDDQPGVVFDCNVFLQAAANEKGAAGQAFAIFEQERVQLFVSEEILREIRDVLDRPLIRQAFHGLSDIHIGAFLKRVETKAILITNVPEEFVLERDPGDSKYINLAIVTNAVLLVSRDRDLLDLMSGIEGGPARFRLRYPFLRILNPADFVRTIEQQVEQQTD